MAETFEVVSVNVSEAKGTAKRPAASVVVDARGVVGDAHAAAWHRQVSLLSQERIAEFSARTARAVRPGEFAENVTTRGIDLRRVAPLDRLHLNEVELEVTQIGKACHGDECAIFREVGECLMPKEGIFCRVLTGGPIRPGDAGRHVPRALRLHVVTLSDRAFSGEYADRSGPEIRRLLEEFLAPGRWHAEITSAVLPDDADALSQEVRSAIAGGADVIFTTGSTGVGPRDIAPETIEALCDKTIPGIMEHVRVKFGSRKPNALLSRGVAAVAGTTQIYTLPGSVRAVREYAGEILKTLEHLIFMLHGIDVH